MGFIIGCGRSGTTILGQILSEHAQIAYFFEPWHLWRAVDSRTDVTHLFGATEAEIIMDADMYTPEAQRRFRRLFLERSRSRTKLCVEKISYNAMRIGYLELLSPGAKYVHIVRDGVEVASSIAWLAETNLYKLAFRTNFNQWWGENGSKWSALKRNGVAAGYFADEVELLDGHCSRAAYEWLVSLGEIDRNRAILGNRLYELRLVDLVRSPEQSLRQLCTFLDIEPEQQWLRRGGKMIKSGRGKETQPVGLPPTMRAAFNTYQERFGFAGRAIDG